MPYKLTITDELNCDTAEDLARVLAVLPAGVQVIIDTAAPAVAEAPAPKVRKKRAYAKHAAAPKRDEVLKRFTKLVNDEFERAIKMLEQFDVAKFSDLADNDVPAFAALLQEAGY